MEEYKKYWNNALKMSGRATRREFWMPVLFNIIISIALGMINDKLSSVFSLLILIPTFTNEVRRFHDINKSAWWVLIELIPIVGIFMYIYYMCKASVNEGNIYGENSTTVTADYTVANQESPISHNDDIDNTIQ